jgi:hypothetical protein
MLSPYLSPKESLMTRLLVSTLVTVLCLAPTVQASTLPKVDFKAGQHIVAAGLLDANYDYAVTDHWSLGVSSAGLLLIPIVPIAARSTLKLLQTDWLTAGLTVSAGITPNAWGPRPWYELPEPVSYWVQPALNATLGAADAPVKLRLTVGPLFMNGGLGPSPVWWFWPNAEVAFRLTERHELTLGGNALVGWRGVF